MCSEINISHCCLKNSNITGTYLSSTFIATVPQYFVGGSVYKIFTRNFKWEIKRILLC